MKGSNSKQQVWESGNSEAADSELRSGGMLVQGREDEVDSKVPLIKIKVYRDSNQHDVTVPAQSTFGDLKGVLAPLTGLAPEEQRLLFRGKEKDDSEHLHNAGVKDMSKVILLEDPASWQWKIEQMQRDQGIVRACEAVAGVKHEVDKLVEKVNALQSSVHRGAKVEDQDFVVLTELFMMQLLKLDGIEAEGEARVQRKTEVRRIQHYVETLDALKAAPRNPIPDSSSSNGTSISTQWQAFDSGWGRDDSTTMREVATSSRVRHRDPSPCQVEVPYSPRQRRRLHQMEPLRASTDWSVSPISHQLLTPDEMPSRPKFETTVFKDLSQETPNSCDVDITISDIVTPQADTALPSNFVSEGADYQSEIYYRYPSSPDPRNRDVQDSNLIFLRDVISRMTPESPESLDRFISYANASLDFLAHTGLDESTLRYWETLCREVEFLIRQMRSLSISRTRASLPELHERIRIRREVTELAHGEFEMSSEAMRHHRQRSIDIGSEIDSLTVKLKDLWREFTSLLSRRTDLQVMQDRQARAMEREQHRYQIKHHAMIDVDALLARAIKELQTVETEYQTLATITTHLRDLQSQLF